VGPPDCFHFEGGALEACSLPPLRCLWRTGHHLLALRRGLCTPEVSSLRLWLFSSIFAEGDLPDGTRGSLFPGCPHMEPLSLSLQLLLGHPGLLPHPWPAGPQPPSAACGSSHISGPVPSSVAEYLFRDCFFPDTYAVFCVTISCISVALVTPER
jgi:hypothetical protein